MNTEQFARELGAAISHTLEAHSQHPKRPKDARRLWDQTTPYAIHPTWCAMTLLTEKGLPESIRYVGYKALLWHDTLEDTNLPLPADCGDEVRQLVQEMTFDSFADERERVWDRSKTAKLLKLYDKVSNLLDGYWMASEKWNDYVAHTLRLTQFVEDEYGELNIVKIARAIAVEKPS